MRRDRIIQALDKLSEALHAAQIREVMRVIRTGGHTNGGSRTQMLLMAYNVFSRHYQQFGEDERRLLNMFQLSPLANIAFWSELIELQGDISRKMVADIDVGIYNILYVMPKIRDVLDRESDRPELYLTAPGEAPREVVRLRVLVGDKTRPLVEVAGVVAVIQAVDQIYEHIAALSRSAYAPLTLGAVDSSEVKAFDFFGMPGLVAEVNQLLIGVWDRIKYASHEDLRYQIEIALMAVGFERRVQAAVAEAAFSADDGQAIERQVLTALESFFRNGAYTEEMDRIREVRASQVLKAREDLIEYRPEEQGRAGVPPYPQKAGGAQEAGRTTEARMSDPRASELRSTEQRMGFAEPQREAVRDGANDKRQDIRSRAVDAMVDGEADSVIAAFDAAGAGDDHPDADEIAASPPADRA